VLSHHPLLAEVPAAVPVVVAAGEGAASLFTLLLWGIALSLLIIWRHTLGALFVWVADELDKAAVRVLGHTIHFLGPVASALRAADHAIQVALSETATGAEKATLYLFNQAVHLLVLTGHTIWQLGYRMGEALQGLVHTTIPRLVDVGTHALSRAVHRVALTVAHVEQTLTHKIARSVAVLEHALAHDFGIARRGIDVLERDLAHAEKRVGRLAGRLSRVEKLLGLAAFAGLLVRALERLGLKWLRCGNVNKVGKQLCGMNPSLLESLLADALLIGGTLSLVALAEEMQGVVGESAGLIQRFWDAA